MPRSDANRIALKATSAILGAAQKLTLEVNGHRIAVTPQNAVIPRWPKARLDGINEAEDGPWPSAVRLRCEWDTGACWLVLRVTHWRPNRRPTPTHQVSLDISLADQPVSLVWSTVADHVRKARDGDRVDVWASPTVRKRSAEFKGIRDYLNQTLYDLIAECSLPRSSRARVDAFTVAIPGAEVTPSPHHAFRTLVHLALIKLPFLDRGDKRTAEGRPFIDIDTLMDEARAQQGIATGKQTVMHRMPGGHRGFKVSIDKALRFVASGPIARLAFLQFAADELEVPNWKSIDRISRTMKRIGLIDIDDGTLSVTARGRAYLDDPGSERLFAMLHETHAGMLAALVLVDRMGGADARTLAAPLGAICEDLEASRKYAGMRLDWLASLGFTERIGGREVVTQTGRAQLEAHVREVDELASLYDAYLDDPESAEPDEGDNDDELGASATAGAESNVASEVNDSDSDEPAHWADDRLDLSAGSVAPHLGKLRLPDGLLEQLCAALSSGKHLLLVGPPGTGKTEIAQALARAAVAEEYCRDLFTATASADWTTYETIGGYALQRNGNLSFRPGVFLRAVEARQWLLIDELNRADVDKAFGELMTVLSGKGTDTAYELEDGRKVSMGRDPERHVYHVPGSFRVLATMNTWDKTSLFRLSYAVQRRFAIVQVGIPEAPVYAELIQREARNEDYDPALDDATTEAMLKLFSPDSVLEYRAIGPAVALDMVRYLRRRQTPGRGLVEAVAMFLLPQLEGLERLPAERLWSRLREDLTAVDTESVNRLRDQYREVFPYITLDDGAKAD